MGKGAQYLISHIWRYVTFRRRHFGATVWLPSSWRWPFRRWDISAPVFWPEPGSIRWAYFSQNVKNGVRHQHHLRKERWWFFYKPEVLWVSLFNVAAATTTYNASAETSGAVTAGAKMSQRRNGQCRDGGAPTVLPKQWRRNVLLHTSEVYLLNCCLTSDSVLQYPSSAILSGSFLGTSLDQDRLQKRYQHYYC